MSAKLRERMLDAGVEEFQLDEMRESQKIHNVYLAFAETLKDAKTAKQERERLSKQQRREEQSGATSIAAITGAVNVAIHKEKVLATARAKNLRNNDLASARATQRRMETEEAVQAMQGINDGLLARHEVASELRQARVARQQDESTKAAAAAWQMTSGARSREAASRQTGNLEAFREVESETRALKEYQDQTRLRLEEKLREAVCKKRLQGWTNFC